jgi:hypothetical protein
MNKKYKNIRKEERRFEVSKNSPTGCKFQARFCRSFPRMLCERDTELKNNWSGLWTWLIYIYYTELCSIKNGCNFQVIYGLLGDQVTSNCYIIMGSSSGLFLLHFHVVIRYLHWPHIEIGILSYVQLLAKKKSTKYFSQFDYEI